MEKLNVVIADTNDGLLNAIREKFENDNSISIIGLSKDGENVLKLLQENTVDVVITDLILPVIDGFTLIEQVMKSKKITDKPKFIILSGISNEKIINTAFSLGAAYFILKPFDIDSLLNRVKQVAGLDYYENNILLSSKNTSLIEFEGDNTVQTHVPRAKDMEMRITEIIHELGVPAHIKGYRYLIYSIILCVNDMEMLGAVTKIMYPEIAKKFSTTPSRVERAIRHSIELSWQQCSPSKLYKLFGYTVNTKKGKPTNSEYIALIADKVRLEYKDSEQKVM
ncbi:MAG: sporulation transcription factor Spo0A [Lachnospiraceae bacterium]|nr:sporulation transcription factor Spo0A [Lachnospiraceae bacterium]